MTAIHDNILVIIGKSETRLTPENPLTFDMRAQMLKAAYPNIQIMSLLDHPDDHTWSANLDRKIAEVMYLNSQFSPDPILYGGRDSFLQHYHGRYRTFELPPVEPISGTEIRESVEVKHSEDFRRGMIYAAKHRFPISYQTVDVAIVQDQKVLLGRKKIDGEKWRFIGGFVSPLDETLEAAAMREAREETGIEPSCIEYIGSTQIDDFRYPKGGTDRIMTAFFCMNVMFGAPKAADDIDEVRWFTFAEVNQNIALIHLPLANMLYDFLFTNESEGN
jgi:bifunctional NMN adenylyltransferase/nudix hydrolase